MEQDQKNQNEEEPLEELRKRLEAERREATRKRRERMRQDLTLCYEINKEDSKLNSLEKGDIERLISYPIY